MNVEDETAILLVADEPAKLTALVSSLEELEYPVLKAHSAMEALKYLLQNEVAVILLDVEMPDTDGFATVAHIRAGLKTRIPPIIFLTEHSYSQQQSVRAYSAGAVDYLAKPLDGAMLRAKVAIFVKMAQNMRRLESEIFRRHKAEAELRQLNSELEQRVQERTADSEALNRRLEQMLAQTHDRVRNNLQMLTALIDMQYQEMSKSRTGKELERMGTHIRVLAIVHDLLTVQSVLQTEVPLVPVHDMLHKVLDLMQQTAKQRTLSLEVEKAYFEGRPGTSLGLITNELCSNALQHGTGEVELTFKLHGNTAQLQVCDDGPGFGANFLPKQAAKTGLHFIEDLTRHDLRGHVHYENRGEGGARVIITMPHKPHVPASH